MIVWHIGNTLRHFPFGELAPVSTYIGTATTFPVLIIWGEKDGTCPFQTGSQELMSYIPRSTLVAIERGKHMIVVEYPSQLASCLHAFHNNESIQDSLKKLPGNVSVINAPNLKGPVWNCNGVMSYSMYFYTLLVIVLLINSRTPHQCVGAM